MDVLRGSTIAEPSPVPRAQGGTTAGIVAYHPDPAELVRLATRVGPEVDDLVIFANSPIETALEDDVRTSLGATPLTVVRPAANCGLGAAYNALLQAACDHERAFVLLLDQDSLPEPGAIARLAEVFDGLRKAGETPAIVGPRPESEHGQPMKMDVRDAGSRAALGAERTEFVISSGSLVSCAAWKAVGPFREDFFIDGIDLEWCMRANARGHTIWSAREVRMRHRLGQGIIRLPFGLLLTDQPPRRIYTYLRNQLVMARLPHVPVRHKAKVLLSMPIRVVVYLYRNRFSEDCRRAVVRGIVDGLRHRLGPPDRAFRAGGA